MRACMPRDSRSGNRTYVTNLALTIYISGPWKLQVPLHLIYSNRGRRSGSFKTYRERRSGSFKTYASQKLKNKEMDRTISSGEH
jgi:hypothetical protein